MDRLICLIIDLGTPHNIVNIAIKHLESFQDQITLLINLEEINNINF
jgi:hypothetical protein